MKEELKRLIIKYKKESEEIYDEYSHGDSLARQMAYQIVTDDLLKLLYGGDKNEKNSSNR